GACLPLLAYPALRMLGRLNGSDAASIAGHYGSVSVVTFAVGVSFLVKKDVAFEEYMPLFVALMEVPGIVVGVLLARVLASSGGAEDRSRASVDWGALAHEIFLGKSVVLLAGGLVIGWIAGPKGLEPMSPLFFGLFKGVLALFLLEMGLVAASRIGEFKRAGPFLIGFGVVTPVVFGTIGTVVGHTTGLSAGGATLLGVLAASASYIAAPAAMRIAIPEANPTLSIVTALGVTFPFNLTLGVPLYHAIATRLTSS
ncbi:MAG: sodium-dependent bicarbonate transport family permease, partial [Betaproteobacteria bacterium]|nr:sodium-dependent bicarbonate transport family permease [Betaproteobacteria bacterium]